MGDDRFGGTCSYAPSLIVYMIKTKFFQVAGLGFNAVLLLQNIFVILVFGGKIISKIDYILKEKLSSGDQ